MVVFCHTMQNLCIIRKKLSLLFWPQKLSFNKVPRWRSDVICNHNRLLRPRLVKDECSSNLFHHGLAGTSLERTVSWPRYSHLSLLTRQWWFLQIDTLYQVSASEALSLLWRSQSPFTKAVMSFRALGPVPVLGKPSQLGFLGLGLLPVCTLLTGSTT